MKKIVLLSYSVLITAFSFAQDWNTIHSFSPNQTTQSIAIGHGDTLMACSALYNGTALNIKRTNDNGGTWNEQYTGYTSQNFRKMATPDSVNFFAIANAGILIGNWGTDEWTTVSTPTDAHLRDIFFLNNDKGFITADAGLIFKTTDGGATWAEMMTEGAGGGSINNIYFTTEMDGFICGFGFLRRTTDGGATWADIPGFVPEHAMYQLQELDFLSAEVGYVCGDIGYIYKTTDGGTTWTQQTTGTEVSLQGIDMLTEMNGYACGYEATVLGTVDGGLTWTVMTTDQTENFRAIQFNQTGGFIVTHLGNVLYFPRPGATLLPEKAAGAFTVYPNPAQSVLNLNVPTNEQILGVELYDLEGKVVLANNGYKLLNINMLPNGLYVLKCRTDKAVYSEMIVKQSP